MAKSPAQKFWDMVNETKQELFGSKNQEEKSEENKENEENENTEKLTKEEILKEIEKLEERIRKLKEALEGE